LRVYPIPARGTKVVHLAYDQELTDAPYVLDLRYGETLQRLEVRIDNDGERRTVRTQQEIRLARRDGTPLVAFSPADSMWYCTALGPRRTITRLPSPARHATVLYDVSASAAHRDEKKLRAFLATFSSTNVVPFHIDVDAPVGTLDGIAFGGATNLQAMLERLPEIAAAAPSSRLVLVSDGINTLGSTARLAHAVAAVAKIGRPLTVVNASDAADDHFLRKLARVTNGWYIDLSRSSIADAVQAAMNAPDAAPRTATTRSRSRMRNGRTLTSEKERDMVRRSWARTRLRELLDFDAPAQEVLAHGLAFRQITPRTSLLVLDGWQDYEQHGLPIPPELRAQRAADLAEIKAHREELERQSQQPSTMTLRRGAADPAGERLPGWFMTGAITFDYVPLPGATVTLAGRTTQVAVSNANGEFRFVAPREPRGAYLTAELTGLKTVTKRFRRIPKGSHLDVELTVLSITETITVTAEAPAFAAEDGVYADRSYGSFTVDKESVVTGALPTRNVRALTELAEAFADDGAVVRIVARVLAGWGRADLAAQLFERAKELGMPEDAAVLKDAPALEIDAMWDANYSDIDLHVIEPGGEEVWYRQKESSSGGRLHQDITGGYGPELYTLDRLRDGEYQILLSYFDDDDTQVSRRTLAHVIVRVKGERRDYLLVLGGKSEKTLVATVP
jgi:hypothetical protein